MMAALQDFFESYTTRPVTGECHKQLGVLLQQCPFCEVEQFLLAYHPTQLHLQLLRALAARALGICSLLLDGIRSESKEVSTFCAESASLYSSSNSDIYDPNVLLPLLQMVSFTTRNKILVNLAKYMTNNDKKADSLFESIVDIWGPAFAKPLLCRTSEVVIQKQLEDGHLLSSFQILTITRRYPKLAMTLLEKVPLSPFSLKAARFVVRNNLPESLSYCVKNKYHKLLSKSTTKTVLKKHLDIILSAPSEWANILDIECVKKVLKPETFELFVLKQIESELKYSSYVSCFASSYIQHLSPNAASSLINKVDWAAIECFWDINNSLLKLLETADRNRIASDLFAKTKSLDWVIYMSCEKSIPILKENLSLEANAYTRARLIENLLATVEINKDKNALEEICEFVAVRYRNDSEVLRSFFQNLPDMSSVNEKIWTIVYSLGIKLLDSSSSNYVCGIDKLFSAALKRNGKSGLKIYVDRFFNQQTHTNFTEDFTDLKAELREECISLIFTGANVASDDSERVRCLKNLLPVISLWNKSSANPSHVENVNKFVLKNSDSQCAIDFVLNKYNGFTVDFIEKCFEVSGNPDLLQLIVLRNSGKINASREALDKLAVDLINHGCWKYIKLLKMLKKRGYVDILMCLSEKSLAFIRDPDHQSLRHTIILLSLTAADTTDFMQETQKFLLEMDFGQELSAPFLSHPKPKDCQDQENMLKQSQQKETIYKGIGNSFSFIDTPSLIVDMLLKFCINGDLMLFVRDSVYSVSFSLPAAGTRDLLSVLVHKPVSVAKHALRIHQLVSDVKTQRAFLTQLIQTETHLTVRTCLFDYALSSLQNTKNVDIWEAVKEMMMRLTPKDKALVILLRVKKVPAQFWEQYVKLLLEKSESLEDGTIEFVSSTLNKICDSITCMPISKQFHENLIEEYFLSDRYFLYASSHESACNLLIAYLKLKADLDTQSDIEHKKQLLVERLNSAATREAIIAYNAQLGCHPTKALLNQFVQLFSSICRQQEEDGVLENMNKLSIFVPTLLSFFGRLDENLLFGPFVCLSLTAITCRQVKDTSESTGYLVGQFIDRVYAKSAGLAQYALPIFVQNYFGGRKFDSGFLQDILLPLKPHSIESLMIRQIIVTKMLPSNWKKDKSLESFREQFMVQVRNTPSEVILFAD